MFHARGGSIARGGGRIEAMVKAAPGGRDQRRAAHHASRARPSSRAMACAPSPCARSSGPSTPCVSRPPRSARRAPAGGFPGTSQAAQRARTGESRRPTAGLVYRGAAVLRILPPGDADRCDRAHADRLALGASQCRRPGSTALLPVPWVFAWSQSRHMLPGWYRRRQRTGGRRRARSALPRCAEAYGGWFFLRNLIDDVETMLARADLEIARYYEELVRRRCATSARTSAASTASPANRSSPSRAAARCSTPSHSCSAPSACATPTSTR